MVTMDDALVDRELAAAGRDGKGLAGLLAENLGNDKNDDGAAEAATEEKIDHRVAGGGEWENEEGQFHGG